MKRSFLLLVAVLFNVSLLGEEAATAQDVRKFFKLTNVAELSMLDVKNNVELQRRANPTVPAAFWKELLKNLKPEEFVERVVPIYQKHYSHAEVTAWIAFFESKPGQAFLKSQVVVLKESATVAQAYVDEVAAPIMKRMKLQ